VYKRDHITSLRGQKLDQHQEHNETQKHDDESQN